MNEVQTRQKIANTKLQQAGCRVDETIQVIEEFTIDVSNSNCLKENGNPLSK